MTNENFFAPIEPFRTGVLAVDDIHELYWEECGNPDGVPILLVHGGPDVAGRALQLRGKTQ